MSHSLTQYSLFWRRFRAFSLGAVLLALLLLAGLMAETLVMLAEPSEYAAVAQGTGVSSPRRRPRPQNLNNPNLPPTPTPRPPTGGENIGSTQQGLTSCGNGVYNFQDGVRAGGFAPNTYVLGMAPVGAEVYSSPELVSFWMVANASGGVVVPPASLSVVTDNGGDLYGTMLAGQMANGGWLLTGSCAAYYNHLSDQQIADLYYEFYNVDNPALSGLTPNILEAVMDSSAFVLAAQTGTELTMSDLLSEGVTLSPAVIAAVNSALPYSDEGTVAPGSTVNSTVDTTEGDRWTFYGAAGDLVTLDVVGNLDTTVALRDSGGTELAFNDDRGDGSVDPRLENVALPYSDTFTVNVRGYNGATGGSYSLNLLLTPAAQPGTDQISEGYVDKGALQYGAVGGSLSSSEGDLYSVSAQAGQVLTAQMESGALDPLLELWDEYGNVIEGNDDREPGDLNAEIQVTLPYSGTYYLVASSFEGRGRGAYSLNSFVEGGSAPPSATCSALAESALFVGALTQTTSGNHTRVRSEPSVDGQIFVEMQPGVTATVLDGPICVGDRVWWQVDYGGVVGWSAEIDRDGEHLLRLVGGTANTVPTPAPSFNPNSQAGAGIDNGLGAVYGDISLTSGFGPDPYPVAVAVSGVNASASDLGGACVGYTQAWPTLRVVYSSGEFEMLRFYFVPDFDADTVMVVNDPDGGWYCGDDSFDTLNPTVDFNGPASGGYQIWVGTYGGDDISGTLYITELDANHP